MKKTLIFLESATKKKTIQSFLGENYIIFATSGHLWELKKSGFYNLGVDLESFKPTYEIIPGKQTLINFWKGFLKKEEISLIYLATDPDREGEGIAEEVIRLLELKPEQYQRLLFYEITPRNVREALNKPLIINKNLVEAQISRQVLDRMIGFCLSTVLRKKLQALSAGRVQSVVLKIIVERELIIKNYEKNQDYIVCGICQLNEKKITLRQINNKGELMVYKEKQEAEEVKKNLNLIFEFTSKKEEQKFIIPKPPLITSLLLFEAKSQLDLSVAQTTRAVQKLYEGIWINEKKKQVGLITYPRTDSTRINQEFINQAYNYIKNKWGQIYCNFQPLWEKKKKVNIQDAHEAIHPTYLDYHPDEIKNSLSEEEYQVYKLIFNHTLASLMSPAKINKITYNFLNNNYLFTTSERINQFAGFLACAPKIYFPIYNVKLKSDLERILQLEAKKNEVQEYIENKPTRHNEGSVVQELERLGVGRPSTYNTFGRILIERGYIKINQKGQLIPTELGFLVNNWLQTNFPNLINEKYTAHLEKELDEISQGQNNYHDFIKNFWDKFYQEILKISPLEKH